MENDWGQGAVNNNVGWGQAANNNFGWGKSHILSYSGQTNIDGIIDILNTVAPIISGTAQEGQTVSCSSGVWAGSTPISYAYKWKRNGNNITGATNADYILVSADVSQTITCEVTATNNAGSASAISNSITPIASTDPNAQAFITAANITDPTQKSAINQLVVDLKGYGIWTKMKAIYPFVGGTASTHKYNLKDPRDLDAAFRLVFNGGWTHSSNGATPNGTNGYANTKLIPSTSLAANSSHLSFYSRSNISQIVSEMGSRNGNDSTGILLVIGRSLNTSQYRVNTGAIYINYSDTNSLGMMTVNRTASNLQNSFRNGVLKSTDTTSSNGLTTLEITISGWNIGYISGYSSKQCAFATIGDGLTNTEATDLYSAVQAFQTTLSRNV